MLDLDSDSKKTKELLALVKENNKILRKMHRAQIWGRVFKILYWLIIIGLMLGLYYFFQPLLEGIWESYQGLISSINELKAAGEKIPDLPSLDSFLP